MKPGIFLLVAGVLGCGGLDETGGAVSLTFTSPSPGAGFTRDQLGVTGQLVALVPVTVDVEGSPARVGLAVGTAAQPDLDAAGAGTAEVPAAGTATLTATAYDASDVPLGTATVDVTVGDATPESCQAELALYQIAFTVGPEREGVADPVTAEVPINGLTYRVLGSADPRSTLFADCTLILSLARAASIMRARNVVEIADLGVYNYRCIGGGAPPDCPNGISQHAFATAIDIAGVTDGSGEFFSVNDDWIIDPDSEDTCAAPSEPGKDQFLHELICELKAAGTWNIVLTPNYNSDHRNHFHVDLTPDSDFIEKRRSE
jgi:hypothetical protein